MTLVLNVNCCNQPSAVKSFLDYDGSFVLETEETETQILCKHASACFHFSRTIAKHHLPWKGKFR